jgi:hypothetical protein
VTFLLPEADRLRGDLPPPVARALGRADRLHAGDVGMCAQLRRQFDVVARGWPAAAMTRQRDAADAASALWLRADPAWVRADMTGARLFACGERLPVTQADVDAFLPALQPLFGDAGMALDAPVPGRWYLRLAPDAVLPAFSDPDAALGTDVFDHLPQPGPVDAAVARRWRSLASEAQVVLHNHPRNARRIAAGVPPINSLWFWGGGRYPDQTTSGHRLVLSDDALLQSLAMAGAVAARPMGQVATSYEADTLVDLRATRELPAATAWWLPAIDALARGSVQTVTLDFMDGLRFTLSRRQRLRVWRKPLRALTEAGGRTGGAG